MVGKNEEKHLSLFFFSFSFAKEKQFFGGGISAILLFNFRVFTLLHYYLSIALVVFIYYLD